MNVRIEEAGIEMQAYDRRAGAYRLRLLPADLQSKSEPLRELIGIGYRQRAD